MPLAISKKLRRRFGFFSAGGFAGRNFRLQCAIAGAACDLLLTEAVESRGVATCFGHNFLFLVPEVTLAGSAGVMRARSDTRCDQSALRNAAETKDDKRRRSSTGALHQILG
jgi:hypothetical protein